MVTAKSFLERFPATDDLENPLVIVPTYNNGLYLSNLLPQLANLGINRFLILDGGSTEVVTVKILEELEKKGHVLRLERNPGPRFFFENTRFFRTLPDIFCVTDPDIEFNAQIPRDFIKQLYRLSLELEKGKVGFALSLEGEITGEQFFFGKRWTSIREWESQFWLHQIPNSLRLDVYKASVDTTFALYNKKFLRADAFFDAVRVAGPFTAKHIPWYTDHEVAKNSPPVQGDSRYTTWNRDLSLQNEKKALEYSLRTINEIQNSLSWRITAPLRAGHKILVKIADFLRAK